MKPLRVRYTVMLVRSVGLGMASLVSVKYDDNTDGHDLLKRLADAHDKDKKRQKERNTR